MEYGPEDEEEDRLYAEERLQEDVLKYPRFDEKEVVYRWRKDWWDGPLNGTISYRDCIYWFDFYCERGSDYYYLLYSLSDEELEVADAWRKELDSLAVIWTALYENPATQQSAEMERIKEKISAHHDLLPDFSKQRPVAWFASGSNASFYPIQMQT